MPSGTVYTETVVFSAPQQYSADAPYQIALVDLDSGLRVTVRILADRVKIGDRVDLAEERGGISYYRLMVNEQT